MCEQHHDLIDYLYDEVTPDARDRMHRHLEDCADCRTEVRALRRVREDLLAWDVPATSSVWTPFAPAPVAPWYQQVPAWALTAAAGLMILFGTAGGFVATALRQAPEPASIVAAAPVAMAPMTAPAEALVLPPLPPGLTTDEVMQLVRQELAGLPRTQGLSAGQAEALVAAAAGEQWGRLQDYMTLVAREREYERKNTEQTLGGLRAQVQTLEAVVAHLAAQQQGRGQQ